MAKKQTPPAVPKERQQTIRQELIENLKERPHSLSDLSKAVGRSEKEIADQLSHIQKTVSLKIDPASCIACGFEFHQRQRLKKPSRCPNCKSNRISNPVFYID